MSNLTIRAISAIVALAVLFLVVYFFQTNGLVIICTLIAAIGIHEMSRLLFGVGYPKYAQAAFLVFCIIHLIFGHPGRFIVFGFLFATLGGLIFHKKFSSLDAVLLFISKFVMGVVYAACLPVLIISMIQFENGILWFGCLLAVVFAGDTGAYISGSLFGKTKIAPTLSPKKSLEGSIGGLFFSALAGFLFSFLIPGVSPFLMIALGLFGGFFGQTGDFFESLVKRIAGVKDSGSIMPGHGGVLDRVDGVYFASPLFYITVSFIVN